jgi:hypothetical protein
MPVRSSVEWLCTTPALLLALLSLLAPTIVAAQDERYGLSEFGADGAGTRYCVQTLRTVSGEPREFKTDVRIASLVGRTCSIAALPPGQKELMVSLAIDGPPEFPAELDALERILRRRTIQPDLLLRQWSSLQRSDQHQAIILETNRETGVTPMRTRITYILLSEKAIVRATTRHGFVTDHFVTCLREAVRAC